MEKRIDKLKARVKLDIGDNQLLLLTCLVLAFIFWFFVKMSKTYTSEKQFELVYHMSDDLAFSETPTKQLRVNLTGRGWALLNESVFGDPLKLHFNFDRAGTFNINRSSLLTKLNNWVSSSNIEEINVDVDFIPLFIEALSSKKVPIQIDGEIPFKKGFQLSGKPFLIPDSVRISGAGSQIENLVMWKTMPLDLPPLSRSVQVPLELIPSPSSELKLDTNQVLLDIQVEPILEQAVFVPIKVLNASDSVSLSNKNIQVNYAVGSELAQELDHEDFEAVVDFSGLTGDETNNTLPVSLIRIPDQVRVIKFTPQSVSYLIIKDELSEDSE